MKNSNFIEELKGGSYFYDGDAYERFVKTVHPMLEREMQALQDDLVRRRITRRESMKGYSEIVQKYHKMITRRFPNLMKEHRVAIYMQDPGRLPRKNGMKFNITLKRNDHVF